MKIIMWESVQYDPFKIAALKNQGKEENLSEELNLS